jgi:hypothetical protein
MENPRCPDYILILYALNQQDKHFDMPTEPGHRSVWEVCRNHHCRVSEVSLVLSHHLQVRARRFLAQPRSPAPHFSDEWSTSSLPRATVTVDYANDSDKEHLMFEVMCAVQACVRGGH